MKLINPDTTSGNLIDFKSLSLFLIFILDTKISIKTTCKRTKNLFFFLIPKLYKQSKDTLI